MKRYLFALALLMPTFVGAISASGGNEQLPLENFYVANIEAKVNTVGKIIFTNGFRINNIRLKVKDGNRLIEEANTNAQIHINYE